MLQTGTHDKACRFLHIFKQITASPPFDPSQSFSVAARLPPISIAISPRSHFAVAFLNWKRSRSIVPCKHSSPSCLHADSTMQPVSVSRKIREQSFQQTVEYINTILMEKVMGRVAEYIVGGHGAKQRRIPLPRTACSLSVLSHLHILYSYMQFYLTHSR